jgi:hypothetical protein
VRAPPPMCRSRVEVVSKSCRSILANCACAVCICRSCVEVHQKLACAPLCVEVQQQFWVFVQKTAKTIFAMLCANFEKSKLNICSEKWQNTFLQFGVRLLKNQNWETKTSNQFAHHVTPHHIISHVSTPTHTHSHTLAHASIHNHTRAHTQHKYYYYCYYYYYSIMFIIITTLLPSLFAQHCHSHYPTGVRQHFDNNSTAIRQQT